MLAAKQMRSSFASFLLTQKKRRPPAGKQENIAALQKLSTAASKNVFPLY